MDSFASGHKGPSVASVVRAVACRIRARTVFMSAPEAISFLTTRSRRSWHCIRDERLPAVADGQLTKRFRMNSGR